MTLRHFIPGAIACIVLLASCELERNVPKPAPPAKEQANATAGGRYRIKSGILKAQSEMPDMGSSGVTTMMFDDYGRLERSEHDMKIAQPGQPSISSKTINITTGRTVYSLNPAERRARRMILPEGTVDAAFVDFEGMTDSMMQVRNMVRKGKDTVLGRECTIYVIDDKSTGMRGTYHVWNNIPLKIDVNHNGNRMVLRPISFDEGTAIDPAMFTVPKDYTIVDIK